MGPLRNFPTYHSLRIVGPRARMGARVGGEAGGIGGGVTPIKQEECLLPGGVLGGILARPLTLTLHLSHQCLGK